MATSLMDFLLAEADTEEIVEVNVSERLLRSGSKFKIRPLTNNEFEEVQKLSVKKTKKGHPSEVNNMKFHELTILKGCLEPNFKDAEVLKKAGVATSGQLISKVLRPGEISTLSDAIQKLNGFGQDLDGLEDEVKNS